MRENEPYNEYMERMEDSIRDLDLKFSELSSEQVEYLEHKAHNFGLMETIVHRDRLGLLKCLFVHLENRNYWQESYYKAQKELEELKRNKE